MLRDRRKDLLMKRMRAAFASLRDNLIADSIGIAALLAGYLVSTF